MALRLATFVKYDVKTPEEQLNLEKKIQLLGQHLELVDLPLRTPFRNSAGAIAPQFLVRTIDQESVLIAPLEGKLPPYRLLSQDNDEATRMLNVYDGPGYVHISLKPSLAEEDTHYYLSRTPR
ncbi:hypothetical protein HYU22_05700 [Candidatus Woesearchaeota archaeon]|nr:hypothetical protein [Candidatus Woesearchaeota archaeon]